MKRIKSDTANLELKLDQKRKKSKKFSRKVIRDIITESHKETVISNENEC